MVCPAIKFATSLGLLTEMQKTIFRILHNLFFKPPDFVQLFEEVFKIRLCRYNKYGAGIVQHFVLRMVKKKFTYFRSPAIE